MLVQIGVGRATKKKTLQNVVSILCFLLIRIAHKQKTAIGLLMSKIFSQRQMYTAVQQPHIKVAKGYEKKKQQQHIFYRNTGWVTRVLFRKRSFWFIIIISLYVSA